MLESGMALKWGVERRLEFIEFRLFWEGGVNRSDIIDMFDVSVPQASKDLTLYQERAPRNAVYDKSAKRYVAAPDFSPIFLKPDPDGYLSRLRSLAEGLSESTESWIASPPDTDIALTPRRRVDSGALRAVLDAVRDKKSLEVHYQSMSKERAAPVWRRMTPHALGYDGFRWHARAYCHIDQKFKDFILSRCLDCRGLGEAEGFPESDELWNSLFQVVLIPNPALTSGRQEVVAQDFAMVDGRVVVPVRRATLYYFSKRLRLDLASGDPRETPVVVSNREDFDSALSEAMR